MILDVRLNIQTADSQVNSEGGTRSGRERGQDLLGAKTDKFLLFDYVFIL